MKKMLKAIMLSGFLLSAAGFCSQAQSKLGYIALSELIQALPEFAKADSIMNDYQKVLSERYQEMVRELNEKDSLLNSPDTARLTRAQIDVKRKVLGDLAMRIQTYQQQAPQLVQQRQRELLTPLQKKANELVWQIARERGYAFIFEKEALIIYPEGDDLLPLVVEKLQLNLRK